MTSAPSRPRRSRASGPSASGRPSGAWTSSCLTEIRAEEAYQRYRAKGMDRRGGRLGPNTVPKPYTPPDGPAG